MPTETITLEDLKKRHEDTAKGYQEALKQQEADRLNSPATKGDVEKIFNIVACHQKEIMEWANLTKQWLNMTHKMEEALHNKEMVFQAFIGGLCVINIVFLVASFFF